MAIAFATLYSQLESLVAATWTDVVSSGNDYIREADHITTIPFESLLEQHLPFAVIVFPAPEPVEMGENNRCYLLRCEFWYVNTVTVGSVDLYPKAEAMAAALWGEGRTPTLVTAGQVWSDPMPRPMWGVGLPINRLLREKRVDVLACGAMASILVGETSE